MPQRAKWSVWSLHLCFSVLLILSATATAVRAETEKRIALVIGNGDYKTAPRLDNPPIDARAVAAAFRRLGFQVVDGYDLPIAQMRTKLAEFYGLLPDATAAVVYYAGHGVSVDDENYMLPTDIILRSPSDLDINAISISMVLKQLKRDERVNVVILDACRDNPFAAELARNRTRAVIGERGLSPIDGDLARGTLIAFASDPKSTALDGKPGENSPFTHALLNHLEDPAVPIDTVMNRVRTEVWAATRQKQLPWVNTSLIGEFRLNPQASAPAAVGQPAERRLADDNRLAQENLLWESAQHSNLAADYTAYLEAYPNGIYAQMARNRIASMVPAAAAPVVAPPAAVVPAVPPPAATTVAALPPAAGQPSAALPPVTMPTTLPAAASAPAAADQTPAVAPAALQAEIGTMATEKSLGLTITQRKQIQQRLVVMDFDAGPVTGAFGDKTRAALADWQTRHHVAATGWLGPLQYAVLNAESESQYQRFIVAQAMSPAVTRSIQPVKRLPVHRVVTVAHKARLVASPQGNQNPIGAFIGGVASGFISHVINKH